MLSVIDFLEEMGKDARLRHASQDDIAQALAHAGIESALGAAIIAKSTSELYALLGQGPMFHVQMDPGKEEEEEDEDEEGDEDGKPSSRKREQIAVAADDCIAVAVI